MEFVLPRVETNMVLNRFRDRLIAYALDYKPEEEDLIIVVDIINDGPYRLQIIEKVNAEEINRYKLFCESLKQKSSA